jgi:hypothetical protein
MNNSTTGLTIAVCAAAFTCFVQSLRIRRINPSVLFPLPTMLSMCLSQDKLMLMASSEIKLFADDSLIYRTINNQTDSDLLQRDLTILENWENK